jgi:hypothetical protein
MNGRPVDFSFWPTAKQPHGHPALQSQIFANDPWNVIESAVNQRCQEIRKVAATGFLAQAKDFYEAAASSKLTTSRPVLSYYAMLNIAKAFILTFGTHSNLDTLRHGLSESNAGNPGLTTHTIELHVTTATNLNAFDEFHRVVCGNSLHRNMTIPITQLYAQSILGHRLWSTAAGRRERFLHIPRIYYMHNDAAKRLWLTLHFFADDLNRISIGHSQLLNEARFTADFKQVATDDVEDGRRLICFEQRNPIPSGNWPSDKLDSLNSVLKNNVWAILLSSPPYRRFYAYPAPNGETVLHQLLSTYALAYYFGSVTRYRPHHFQSMLDSQYGAFIREFVDHQILQFIYLLAAHFDRRDVVKPAVI